MGYGFPPALFDAAHRDGVTRLRWVHSGAAGVGGSLHPGMRESPVVLTNSAGVHAVPMAETLLAMILYFARGLDLAVAAQREGRWDKEPFEAADTPVRELGDATLGCSASAGSGVRCAPRDGAGNARARAQAAPGRGAAGRRAPLRRRRAGAPAAESDYVAVTLPETDPRAG
jgi:hypothetical protein